MSDRLRIAMVAACPFPWPRGTPIRIHRMTEALAHRGHEVHVVTYHLGKELSASPYEVHRIRDVPAYRHTAAGPTLRKLAQLDPMLERLLRRLHCELNFDIVHAHHYEGLLVASHACKAAHTVPRRAGSQSRARIVYDAHTTLAGELPHYSLGLPGWLKRGFGRLLDRRLPRRADHVIAVSDSIRDILVGIHATTADRISVIPNGVAWEHFHIAAAPPTGRRTIIFTGNTSDYQRVDLLLEAFAHLHRRQPDVRLMIVTETSFQPYEKLAQRLGVRTAIDLRSAPFSEQPALLAAADVAVNPRVQCDGLPQKLLNYMAAGKPIVSFDGSAVHLKHEHTGLRVPDGDVAAMADAIGRLLDNPAFATTLGNAARRQVQRDFSWDNVATRVESVYSSVLAAD